MSQIKIKNTGSLILTCALALSHLLTGHIASAQESKTSGPFSAETVLLSTDRSVYMAGETIYLSATILESDNFSISGLSKVCRIELLDSRGKTGIREILASDEGLMAGTIKLPENLATGWYRLRAYTSWMRNHGPSFFSYMDLRIINPADAGKLTDYSRDDTLMVSLITRNGTALSGARNHCAVRSVSLRGRPVAVKGSLVSSRNDTVAHFSTGCTGWGILGWTPEAGIEYHIVMESDPGMPVLTEVPQHSDKAVSVSVSDPHPGGDDQGKGRNITVTLSGNISGTGIKLLVHRVSSWYIFNEAIPRNRRLSFVISTADLPDGLISFSFLDDDNRVLASAMWIKGDPLSGRGYVTTKARSGEDGTGLITEYSTGPEETGGSCTLTTRKREPAEISDNYIGAIPGWAATWDIPAGRDEREGWLLAMRYPDSVAESFFKEGQGKPRVPVLNFSDVKDTRQSVVEYLPETRGNKLSGTLSFEDGSPAGFQKLSLTGLNENIFITTRTFPDGSFHFAFPGRTGSKDMILSHINRPAKEMSLTISSEFDPRFKGLPPRNIYLTNEEIKYVNSLIVDNRLKNIYRDTIVYTRPSDTGKAAEKAMFYGNPDRVIYVDDYIRLPDMRELIFEVVPFVSVRKEGDDYSLKVISENPYPGTYDPIILIDGIPLLSFIRFLDLPPDRFKRIDIINSIYIHGNQIFSGVVNFISRNGDLAGLDLPAGSQILSLDIPGPSPGGELVKSNIFLPGIPTLEPTLSCMVVRNTREASFTYNGNPANGSYITILRGIDGEGRWVSLSSDFEISGFYLR
ncbi:MAG: hypothetical protein RQ743_06345 [Bacteroidales bacterium]|nr:hypothetical protein [Bacteroidales bacterium]